MTVTPQIVEKALHLVFGSASRFADLQMVSSLDERTLKSAFREKAMHFHPDRAEVLGLDESKLSELFKRLHGAYRLLNHVVADDSVIQSATVRRSEKQTGPQTGPGPAGPGPDRQQGRRSDTRSKTAPNRMYYHGRTPEMPLKFAQFLYYNGVIDWQSMIDAVTWQLNVRPKIGEIGRAYRFFDHSGVISVIREKDRSEFFGGAALRLGMVNRFQLNAMIGKQKSLNYPIGRYFLENGILSNCDLDTLLQKCRQHNYHHRTV